MSGSPTGPFGAGHAGRARAGASAERGRAGAGRPAEGGPAPPGGRAGAAPPPPREPLDQAAVLDLYRASGALRRGHFVLSSGRHSDTYLQSALVLQWPWLAAALGRAIAASHAGQADVVVAPAVGGLLIGHEVARELGVRMVFAERAGGEMRLRRSFALDPGERALLTEDVVTTGGSAREVAGLVAATGAVPVALAAIVDRRPDGAADALPTAALARVDAAAWAPADCPICRRGGVPESPGSRRLEGR